jgi:hypothetical protein
MFENVKKCIIFVPSFEDGVVAQMVEQRTENPCVTGSIPVDATADQSKNPGQFARGFYF